MKKETKQPKSNVHGLQWDKHGHFIIAATYNGRIRIKPPSKVKHLADFYTSVIAMVLLLAFGGCKEKATQTAEEPITLSSYPGASVFFRGGEVVHITGTRITGTVVGIHQDFLSVEQTLDIMTGEGLRYTNILQTAVEVPAR